MNTTEQTLQQINRAINKIAAKYPKGQDSEEITDIHLRVLPESGELLAFDDSDKEVNRCVIEQWIDSKDEDFYTHASSIIRKELIKNKKVIEAMGILRPFSFVLEDEDRQHISELYLVDDDIVIIDEKELMEGLSEDLDSFFDNLMSKD